MTHRVLLVDDHKALVQLLEPMFEQQGYEVTVDITSQSVGPLEIADAISRFHELHERLYGVRFHVPVELVALRITAVGETPEVLGTFAGAEGGASAADAIISHEKAFFDDAWQEIPHYDRDRLAIGHVLKGPAVIHQYDSTTLVLPKHKAEIDEYKNIVIWPDSEGN